MDEVNHDPRQRRMETGIPGLDAIVHGGLLRQAVYMVRGRPGAGKTILANQLCFAHAAQGGRVLYVTLLSETHERMLFNIGQLDFFEPTRIPTQITYLSAFAILDQGGLKALSEMLRREARAHECSLLILDGLVAVEEAALASTNFKKFIYDMQVYASLRGTTVVLLSSARHEPVGPEHTMVDGVLEVRDNRVGKHKERELEVTKFRGSNYLQGGHAFQITSQGIVVYPRLEAALRDPAPLSQTLDTRLSTGMPSLDEALHGGLRVGSTTVLMGPTGSGKTTLGLHFLNRASQQEPALLFGFYETPQEVERKAEAIGLVLADKRRQGVLDILWHPPTERVLDALGNRLVTEVRKRGIKRLFVDGIDGFLQSAADPERVSHFFSALTNELRQHHVSALYTQELQTLLGREVTLPLHGLSALVENLLLLRYVEQDARLARSLTVIKLRNSSYDATIRELRISEQGAELLGALETRAERPSLRRPILRRWLRR